MKMSEDRCQEDQDEEDQRKTSKLIAYLSIKSENCKMRTCNALSNSQVGVLKSPIVHSLKLIKITSNQIGVFPRVP